MRFRDLSIRSKLLLMTLVSSGVAVALASGGFLAWDLRQVRDEIDEDVNAQLRLLAESTAAAVSFEDTKVATETLRVLRYRPRTELACLYNADAALFAFYRRPGSGTCPAVAPPDAFGWSRLEKSATVSDGGNAVGTLFIRRELSDMNARLRVGAATVAGLLLLAIAAAFVIASRMQRSIAAPLLRLAAIARAISTGQDHSLRAVPLSHDEVGVVVHAFNEMLDRIDVRTAALSHANADLEREIDERRIVEEERTAALIRERDANRLKDEFLATLSHELRTPLNAVLGWARLLRSATVEPATQARALESIERNARAQARLIEDLLEISRIVTGKLRLQVRECDLAAIVDAASEIVQPAAAAKRLSLAVEVLVRPAMTAGDPDRLQQIIWNLLSNAVKFTPPEGSIRVRLERADGYRLTVRDTGPGVEPKFLPFIFEPFRQADGSASREHGGLGLGLAIAKQLVELHGGTIGAISMGIGTGATFDVRLPSVIVRSLDNGGRDGLAAPPPPVTAIDGAMLDGLHVLIVDDEEDARLLLQTALIQYGADVTIAATAAAAVAAFDARQPDILLSDIGMPFEDGYALIRQLRARPLADGGNIPAIAITAYASASDRLAAQDAGYHAHVAKPFDPADVARLVGRLVRARRSAAIS
jgi:signal transduction histidine kinase/ActR/RegA family two-component response regulator